MIRQLCSNLKVPDHPALYALRDDQDELVTDENLRKKIKDKVNLKYEIGEQLLDISDLTSFYRRLVSSPVLEAVDIMEKLAGREDKSLKLALYSLQKYIQVSQNGRLFESCLHFYGAGGTILYRVLEARWTSRTAERDHRQSWQHSCGWYIPASGMTDII